MDIMVFYYTLYIIFIINCFTELEEVLKVLKEEAIEEANVAIEAQKIAASVTKIHTQKLKAAMDLSDDVSTCCKACFVVTFLASINEVLTWSSWASLMKPVRVGHSEEWYVVKPLYVDHLPKVNTFHGPQAILSLNTVVEQATHLQMDTGSSPTSINYCEGRSWSRSDVK